MDIIPRVVQAIAGDGYIVYAYFNDGTVRLVNVAPLIDKGGVFSQIASHEAFHNMLTVMNGTVAWDITGNRDASTCLDLDPISIYEASPVVKDPLFDVVA